MTVIIPSAKIASRWNGALELRLRHAPLEEFLRARGQKWSLKGDTRITDNLACGTIFILGGLTAQEGQSDIVPAQHAAVGQIACAVSASLALLIQEPTYWRTAALVGTARLLERHIGLSAAAHAAAGAARDYNMAVSSGSQDPEVARIGHAVRSAVAGNDSNALGAARELIGDRLAQALRSGLPQDRRVAALTFDLGVATLR